MAEYAKYGEQMDHEVASQHPTPPSCSDEAQVEPEHVELVVGQVLTQKNVSSDKFTAHK